MVCFKFPPEKPRLNLARCLTLLGSHDGVIYAVKHLELVHAHHLVNPYMDLTTSLWGTKY